MATTAAGSAVPKIAREVAQQAIQRAPFWVQNMPTRQIANILLQHERHMMDYELLYGEVEKSGLFRSKRHFKHCLRMLKNQDRVQIICRGPEKAGSAKRLFSVKLTRRGGKVYTRYSQMPSETEEKDGKQGLAEALA